MWPQSPEQKCELHFVRIHWISLSSCQVVFKFQAPNFFHMSCQFKSDAQDFRLRISLLDFSCLSCNVEESSNLIPFSKFKPASLILISELKIWKELIWIPIMDQDPIYITGIRPTDSGPQPTESLRRLPSWQQHPGEASTGLSIPRQQSSRSPTRLIL